MAKRKIVWSHKAKIKRYKILEFYIKRNQSPTYSRKLNKRINSELKLLIKQPDLGVQTDIEGIRGLIVGDYILFYEENHNQIIIHTIWDCRQDPNKLKIK